RPKRSLVPPLICRTGDTRRFAPPWSIGAVFVVKDGNGQNLDLPVLFFLLFCLSTKIIDVILKFSDMRPGTCIGVRSNRVIRTRITSRASVGAIRPPISLSRCCRPIGGANRTLEKTDNRRPE